MTFKTGLTPEIGAELRRLRDAGLSWDECAAAFQANASTVRSWGRTLRIPGKIAYRPPVSVAIARTGSEALPAMHPETWGILVALTPSLMVPA